MSDNINDAISMMDEMAARLETAGKTSAKPDRQMQMSEKERAAFAEYQNAREDVLKEADAHFIGVAVRFAAAALVLSEVRMDAVFARHVDGIKGLHKQLNEQLTDIKDIENQK